MTGEAMVFALFGNPVGHSLSPVMHNAVFRALSIPAVYRAYAVETAEEAVAVIHQKSIKGASVTLPHKEAFVPLLDDLTDSARAIKAVNTLIVDGSAIVGDNTDWIGFVRALEERFVIEGKTVAVLGAGGAARAALFGIIQRGGRPVIINRSSERARALAGAFDCPWFTLGTIQRIEADCLVNCTSVGLFPRGDLSPLPPEILRSVDCVMDTIYNPLETKLLRDAREAGCTTVTGVEMFVHQGAEQLRRWLSLDPPLDLMRKTVLEALAHEDN